MNTDLVEYGIYQEESDYRAHVSVMNHGVYVFETHSAIEAISDKNYRTGNAYQNGIKTGVGYLVPPEDISGCIFVPVDRHELIEAGFKAENDMTQKEKGDAAVHIVKKIILDGRWRLPFFLHEISDYNLQVSGVDIQINQQIKIQVKCDYKSGGSRPRCTGNLFIQIKECNPFRVY